MSKPFCMFYKQDEWVPHRNDSGNDPYREVPRPSPGPQLLEIIEIHKRPDGSRYLNVDEVKKCYEIGSHKKFCLLYDPPPPATGEWVPCKGASIKSAYDVIDCPEPDSPIEYTLIIFEGSQWVRIGGRWYKIG
jgi:hypothetical protein